MIEMEHKPLSRDDRDEIAAVATAATRRNRPTHYVAAASVLLVGALAMMGSALMARRAAARALDRATYENVQATYLIERITALRAEDEGAGAPGVNEAVSDILARLANSASRAGISVSAPAENSAAVQGTPFTRRQYAYTFTASSIEDVFEWVGAVQEQVPGTSVYSVSLTPVAATRNWAVRLTFARLERTGR